LGQCGGTVYSEGTRFDKDFKVSRKIEKKKKK
jgi:hypothetical protein